MKTGRPPSKTSPEAIEVREREAKALELRADGKTCREIAAELGYAGAESAWNVIMRALKAIPFEGAKKMRRLEGVRLEKMWRVAYLNAQAGNVDAINACLRIMERRARLYGLDAPVKVKAKVTATGGVLVVPGMLDEETWAAQALESQQKLLSQETDVAKPTNGTAAT